MVENIAAGMVGGVSTKRMFLRLNGSVLSDSARYFLVASTSLVAMERTIRGSLLSRKMKRVKLLSRLFSRLPESPRLKIEAKMKNAIGVLVLSTMENGTGPVMLAFCISSASCISRSRSVETVSVSTSTMNGLALVVENGSESSDCSRRSSADLLLDMSGMFGRLTVGRLSPSEERRVFQK